MTTEVQNNPVTAILNTQILEGLAVLNEGNEILLADETGTKVSDIDKALKAEAEKIAKDEDYVSELPELVNTSWAEAQEAYTVYRAKVDVARNVYLTEHLGEDAKASGDVDKDALKETRTVVMDAIKFLKSFAANNGLVEVEAYADSIQVPQVGRQGVSTVGTKKPRVFVTIDGVQYESFSKAAAAISDKENKVIAGDISSAWTEAGGNAGDFTFGEYTVGIEFKNKD